MAIWALADLHASRPDGNSGLLSKPMDVFGTHWHNHLQRVGEAWARLVSPEDTVLVAGDIDWALHLEDAHSTLAMLSEWPGHKILLRGNHDYWWSSKTTNRVRGVLPPGITLLHNSATLVEGFNVCGTKGSPVSGAMDWTPHEEKLLRREQGRLRVSLEARSVDYPTIVALHHPPFYVSHPDSPYRTILDQYGVVCCVFGHLHGDAAAYAPSGTYGKVDYRLVAIDAVGFQPVLIAREGMLVAPAPVPQSRFRRRATSPPRAETQHIDYTKEPDVEENRLPLDDLKDLAEHTMDDKRREGGDEGQIRELYDVPSESPAELARQEDNGNA